MTVASLQLYWVTQHRLSIGECRTQTDLYSEPGLELLCQGQNQPCPRVVINRTARRAQLSDLSDEVIPVLFGSNKGDYIWAGTERDVTIIDDPGRHS